MKIQLKPVVKETLKQLRDKLKPSLDGTFAYLFILTIMFFLLEISFFIECNHEYLADFTFVSDNLHIPLSILPGLVFFISAQLILHFAYCVLTWMITQLVIMALHVPENKHLQLAISIWFLGVFTLIVANAYYYPNAKFSILISSILYDHTFTQIIFFALLTLCGVVLTIAFAGLMKHCYRRTQITLSIIVALVLIANIYNKNETLYLHDASTINKPNIIIVGVDSLRPDFLSFFGRANPTPFIDEFLNSATVFSEAITPLARTFPSWTGILTGEYPRKIGVRFNLAEQQHIKLDHSLPAILKKQGYETIYATDETRFSNIDKNYGFDRIVTPPIGLNDFLLGTFNDFVLSNLLVNTVIGQYLFPYSYANRPVYYMYQPDSFLHFVAPVLRENRQKPLFLAIHFCLPHHPYIWASLPDAKYSQVEKYAASIVRVDQQVKDFFVMLQQAKLLDHAIVVLLSDHGEALEMAGDRITESALFITNAKSKKIPTFYPPSLDDEAVNQSAGHGTDVLGLPQYHTLLAFKFYGLDGQVSRVVPGVVSLLDIKSTVLDLLHLKHDKNNGESLAAVVLNKSNNITHQHVFLESDYSPAAIRTVYPDIHQAMLEGIDLFEINAKTTRLTVKPSMAEKIIISKQLAVIDGEWMLALYPQNKATRMPILVNLVTGEWTNDMDTVFAQHSPAATMLQSLRQFYGDEIKRVAS